LPIPFSTRTIEAGYPYKNKNVIQEELGPYLPAMAEKYYVAGEDAALLVVRLTTLAPSGASVLGVNWAHVLGDGAALHRFLTDVSIFYNQPTAELEAGEDMPTLEPHVRLPPYTEEIGREYALDILTPRPLEEVGKGYADAVIQSQVFHIVLTCDEVAHIMATRVPGEKLSENDMFTGWWISLLERAGQHVDYVVQTINVSLT
jgi:hypothetical protein